MRVVPACSTLRLLALALGAALAACVSPGGAPDGGGGTAGALPEPPGLGDDPAAWPNRWSYRNSDPWISENHQRLRRMKPRVLVLNFSNDTGMDAVREHAGGVVRALAESTRYHGFENPDAPAFLEYEVVAYIDLRDAALPATEPQGTSSLFPVKPDPGAHVLCDYAGFYSDDFAPRLGFPDPREPGRFLNLHELIDAGYLHELWLYANHDGPWPALEVAELKQHYDDGCAPIEGRHGPAGNGHDDTMPWSGRTFRIAFFNPHRGVGCAMENFGHGLEWTGTSGAIPYLTRYFLEFAELDLDARYGLPFNSLYALHGAPNQARYTGAGAAEFLFQGRTHRVENYVATGGNVHFPPGARHHYDMHSPHTVASTIEGYRRREGAGGADAVRPFNADRFRPFEALAPDCMGAWTVFWRQCMPGLDNPCVDDDGAPMKNWWVFLFY